LGAFPYTGNKGENDQPWRDRFLLRAGSPSRREKNPVQFHLVPREADANERDILHRSTSPRSRTKKRSDGVLLPPVAGKDGGRGENQEPEVR